MSKEGTYYQQSAADTLKDLSVEQAFGLPSEIIRQRQQEYGLNQLPSGPKISPLRLMFNQLKDALIVVLLVAAAASLAVSVVERGSLTEPLLILAIVAAIVAVGFFNEYKAERTVEALRALVAHTCRVRRNGQELTIPVAELVPGDIALLDEGKKVPADLRLLTARHLRVNEASLTGESVPTDKQAETLSHQAELADRTNMLFSGTLVVRGVAEGVVVATGAQTEIGRIASLVSSVKTEPTPMQRKLDDLGKKLGLLIALICIVVFVAILLIDREAVGLSLVHRLLFAFTAAVALAVAAIPEGLAFVVRISLALGARRLAAKNALVRKLSAVESLGSTDVICTDKTGTLTRGEMTVRNLFVGNAFYELTGSGYQPKGRLHQHNHTVDPPDDALQLLEIGVLCNDARLRGTEILGDPTEAALLVAAGKLGLRHEALLKANPRIYEVPFDSNRKVMSTVHARKNDQLIAVKGAPDVLLARCSKILDKGQVRTITKNDQENIDGAVHLMASRAQRVLGFAYKTAQAAPKNETALEQDLIFVGLQGMIDPPRTEVKAVIERIEREAGMRVVMITGDNLETAKAIAKEVGISGDVIHADEPERLSEKELQLRIERIGVFARVNPEHKIAIIHALQQAGHQVAMAGDGVNDAPAIKAADIGVAMGITGTDVAKEAASMILLDDKFVTIIAAIEEGRGIYDNVRKFVNFLLSCNIAEVAVVLLGILLHGNVVLTATQLLFINIVTDGLPAIALGSDPAAGNVMKHKPSHYRQAIINKRTAVEIGIFALLMSALIIWRYLQNVSSHGTTLASSAIFVAIVVYEFVRLIDIRTDYKIRWFSNPWLSLSIGLSLAAQLLIIFMPPLAQLFSVGPILVSDWLLIGLGAIGLFAVMKALNPVLNHLGPEN